MRSFIVSALFAFSSGLHAQTVYTYQFNNNLHGSSGAPDLKAVCPPSFMPHTFTNLEGTVHTVCHFDKQCGFIFNDSTDMLAAGSYTVEMYVELDALNGYRKLIDYKNGTVDNGLYDNDDACTFRGPGTVSGELFSNGTYSFVTITRDGNTKDVKLYVNGLYVDGFNDNGFDYAVYDANKTLRLLQDDTYSAGAESSSGNIALLKIYNYPLDPKIATGHYGALKDTAFFKPVVKR